MGHRKFGGFSTKRRAFKQLDFGPCKKSRDQELVASVWSGARRAFKQLDVGPCKKSWGQRTKRSTGSGNETGVLTGVLKNIGPHLRREQTTFLIDVLSLHILCALKINIVSKETWTCPFLIPSQRETQTTLAETDDV